MKLRTGRAHRRLAFTRIAVFCLFCVVAAWPQPADAAKIEYRFGNWDGPEFRVFLTRPVGLAPDRPVVFVMHGADRNAAGCRDRWHNLAVEYDFLLVVPEFSERHFPGAERYSQGDVFDRSGNIRAESGWSYSAIEALFDDVRARFRVSTDTYSIYGRSGGAQFVNGFIFHVPAPRVNRLVAAEADWYMMPDFEVDYPYGLAHSAVGRSRLERGLGLPLIVLLEEGGTDLYDHLPSLTPEAMAQGPDPLARGKAFFHAARTAANSMGVPFNWNLELIPGAGRDDRVLTLAAIPFLLGER